MSYSSVILADGPPLYARLGGTTQAEALADASPNNRTGSSVVGTPAYGQPSLIPVADATDLSTAFNGTNGLLWDSPTWANVNSITLEAWIKMSAGSVAQIFMERGKQSLSRILQFNVNASNKLEVAFWPFGAATVNFVVPTTLAVGTAYHVVATWDATTGKATSYLNGVQEATQTTTPNNLTGGGSPLCVGFGYAGGNSPIYQFKGQVDEVAIYDKVLTPAQILAHTTAGTTVPVIPAPTPTPEPVKVAASRSHQPLWRVRMLTAAGAQIGDPLPFIGGTISKSMGVAPRCRATVDVPTGMVPTLIDQNYLPTGQRLVFDYKIMGAADDWQVIADLDMVTSTITRPDSIWRLEAADRSIRIALDDTARGGWTEPTGTIDSAIRYIITRTFPTAQITSTGASLTQLVPTGTKTDGDPWAAAVGLATAAMSEVYHRAMDRVFVIRPLPVLAAAPVDALSVGAGGNVTAYDLDHEMGFNTVALSYRAIDGGAIVRVGTWVDTRARSPVSKQRIGTNVVYRESRDVDAAPSQAEADAAAAVLGSRVAGRARSPTIRHVARPWLEPGDTIAVTYSGGRTELQLVDSVEIPLDNSNIQTTTCRSSEYQMEVPV